MSLRKTSGNYENVGVYLSGWCLSKWFIVLSLQENR